MCPVKWHLNALFLRFYLKKNACEEYYDRIKILIIRHLKYCLLLHLGFFYFTLIHFMSPVMWRIGHRSSATQQYSLENQMKSLVFPS